MTQVYQRAGCDCSVAALAMYCGVDYETIWWGLTRRERFLICQGQGLFYKQVARLVLKHKNQHMWYFDEPFGQSLDGYSALLTIHSHSLSVMLGREVNHCVYWDGERTWDPRMSGQDAGPFPDRVVGYEIAGEHFTNEPEGWQEYYDDAVGMSLHHAIGRRFTDGLLPWIEPKDKS